MDVVDVDGVLDGSEAEFVGHTMRDAAFETAAGEPHGEGVDVVIASGGLAHLAHRRAAEFTAPDDDGVIEQATLFEVFHECGARLIDVFAFKRHVLLQILGRAAVVIPIRVVELHKAHTTLDEATCEQAVPRKAGLLRIFDAVKVERGLRFAAGVHQVRRAGLHAEGHFISVDASADLLIARFDEALHVQLTHGIHHLALLRGADFLRRGEIHNRIALIAQRHALIRRRQHAAAPQHGATTRTTWTALQHDKARQVIALAAEAVGHPRAHARTAEKAAAGVHVHLCRRMIEEIRLAGGDEADVIDDRRRVRQVITHPRTGLPVLLETDLRPQQVAAMAAVHESKALPFGVALRNGLPIELCEQRLVFESLQLRRPTRHEEKNDVLRLRGKMRLLWCERRIARHKRSKRHGADSNTATAEKVTTSLVKQRIHGLIRG